MGTTISHEAAFDFKFDPATRTRSCSITRYTVTDAGTQREVVEVVTGSYCKQRAAIRAAELDGDAERIARATKRYEDDVEAERLMDAAYAAQTAPDSFFDRDPDNDTTGGVWS